MNLPVRGTLRSRCKVQSGDRSISIDVKQPANLSPRPSLVVCKNADLGLTQDVTAVAASGTGWVTIVGEFTPSADGAVWFELRNNLDGHRPCYWDNLTLE
jgi:hypothetical protein